MRELVGPRPLGAGLDLGLRPRNPFQVVPVRCGTSVQIVDRKVLDFYLPPVTALRRHSGVNMNNIIQRCYTVRTGTITPQKMEQACSKLLDVLGLRFDNELEPHFALTTMLEQEVLHGRIASVCILFFCLSDISRTTHSPPLARALHSFFTKCGDKIISQEAPQFVIYWGCAIMVSNMSDPQKLDCIHIILKGFPELMLGNDYIGYTQNVAGIEDFVKAMQRVAEMDEELLLADRGRRRLREGNLMRRHRLGAWQRDDPLLYGNGYNNPFDPLDNRRDLAMRSKQMVQAVQQLFNHQKQLESRVEGLNEVVENMRQDGLDNRYDNLFDGADDWAPPRRVGPLDDIY